MKFRGIVYGILLLMLFGLMSPTSFPVKINGWAFSIPNPLNLIGNVKLYSFLTIGMVVLLLAVGVLLYGAVSRSESKPKFPFKKSG